MQVEDLISNYNKWLSGIIEPRLDNNELGRDWLYKGLQYTGELSIKQYQTFFDRTDQNAVYTQRYNNTNIPSKEAHSWYQNEINMIYSFHKCFAMRNATRLQYYRNDLSQKGVRNPTAINQAIGTFLYHRDKAEQKK